MNKDAPRVLRVDNELAAETATDIDVNMIEVTLERAVNFEVDFTVLSFAQIFKFEESFEF